MGRVVLVTTSADLTERVHFATGGAFRALPQGPIPEDPLQFFDLLSGTPPEVILLDPGDSMEQALNLASQFDAGWPSISVVLVSDLGPEISLAAMRAGIRDVLHPAADPSEIRLVLDRAFQVVRARLAGAAVDAEVSAPTVTGKVISVASPKGGVGKTTVSTNLAVGLGMAAPHGAVLVDLDIQFGDVASALSLAPEYYLPDAVHGPGSRDAMALKTFLTQHKTGLFVIPGPESPAAADTVSGEDVSRLLRMLASEFRYVIVDTAPGMNETTLAALDQTSDLVLVTSMDVPGIRGLRKEIDTLNELDMFTDARHIVLNMADPRGGLSVGDVEATIGAKVDLTLPWSPIVTASVNQGIPLLQQGGRDPMTKQLRSLLERIAPSVSQDASRSGRGRHRMARVGAR